MKLDLSNKMKCCDRTRSYSAVHVVITRCRSLSRQVSFLLKYFMVMVEEKIGVTRHTATEAAVEEVG